MPTLYLQRSCSLSPRAALPTKLLNLVSVSDPTTNPTNDKRYVPRLAPDATMAVLGCSLPLCGHCCRTKHCLLTHHQHRPSLPRLAQVHSPQPLRRRRQPPRRPQPAVQRPALPVLAQHLPQVAPRVARQAGAVRAGQLHRGSVLLRQLGQVHGGPPAGVKQPQHSIGILCQVSSNNTYKHNNSCEAVARPGAPNHSLPRHVRSKLTRHPRVGLPAAVGAQSGGVRSRLLLGKGLRCMTFDASLL